MAEIRKEQGSKTQAGAPDKLQDNPPGADEATRRAEEAEAELARLKKRIGEDSPDPEAHGDEIPYHPRTVGEGGEAELRKDSMMAYLFDSLAAGKDIGHYGRLVFAMAAHHFLPHDEVLGWLTRDADFSEEQARVMLKQVEDRDYSPPRRERILAWQKEQDFPILPDPDDPDCGNLYRNLKFPDHVYAGIEHYQEAKLTADD
jgi:hypothetical protein